MIGGIGYYAACRPKTSPILPPAAMTAISKMNFDLLVLPLIYSTLASSVTPQKLGSLWFILVSALSVISISYGVATLLGKLPFFRVENKIDFDALRIAASFPNILALPILIFPTLCEFSVVHDAFYLGDITVNGEGSPTEVEKYKSCVDQSNAMIFVYFFGWNFLFWALGYTTLVDIGSKRQISKAHSHGTIPDVPLDDSFDIRDEQISVDTSDTGGNNDRELQMTAGETMHTNELPVRESQNETEKNSCISFFVKALIKTISSPGFVAMILGFVTACIPPMQDALFEQGGLLRFFGSAMESLGSASSSVGTIVVAASLVHQANEDDIEEAHNSNAQDNIIATSGSNIDCIAANTTLKRTPKVQCSILSEEQVVDNIDTRGSLARRSSLPQIGSMIRRRSSLALAAIRRRKHTVRMHSWFITSRLIVSPALICAVIVAMDCRGILAEIPDLAKMVVIINAGLPGAQLVVITLKSKGFTDSASIVAKVYLPSYLLSAFTIAAWTSVALFVSIPKDSGASFCR